MTLHHKIKYSYSSNVCLSCKPVSHTQYNLWTFRFRFASRWYVFCEVGSITPLSVTSILRRGTTYSNHNTKLIVEFLHTSHYNSVSVLACSTIHFHSFLSCSHFSN
jgi:hypothetical protein